ncbi:hypothetical protein QBC35DRAFT_7732 [Podospora australis]|uniref:Uncharacterized protein n=1 Tax=Podospora australis TaxID=1536484 RepID=A0AAN6X9M4_9PEZI|nr:hypothetical protein QBC35DRAFT_7732 [Podospora australis]
MKTFALTLLSAALASAQAVNNSPGIISNSTSTSATSSSLDISSADFDIANAGADFDINSLLGQNGGIGGLDLNSLNAGGLNLGNIDLNNQDVIVDAILAMLNQFCLGGQLNRNNILSFGFNNDVDLFFQLAQLEKFQQLGFVGLSGIQSLFNAGRLLGGFDLGLFKREIASARKTMKRTRLRRGQHLRRQACPTTPAGVIGAGRQQGNAGLFTTAAPNLALATSAAGLVAEQEAGFTIATADPDLDFGAGGFTIATADPDFVPAATTASVAAIATASAAVAVAAVVPTAAAAAPVIGSFTPIVAPAAAAVVASASAAAVEVPVAAAASAPPAAAAATVVPAAAVEEEEVDDDADEVDNLSDLTR